MIGCCSHGQVRPEAVVTIQALVNAYLRRLRADGLFRDGASAVYSCGCSVDDLAPCGQAIPRCLPAAQWLCEPCGEYWFFALNRTDKPKCPSCGAELERRPIAQKEGAYE